MEGRGEGEMIPTPAPVPLRRNVTGCNSNSSLPSTIHVTSVGIEGRIHENEPTPKTNLSRIFVSVIAFIACAYVLGIVLDFYDIWDPCSIRFPYKTYCSKGAVKAGFLQKSEYVEDSFCIIPGIFHTSRSSGWNEDCTEHPEISHSGIQG